LEIIRSEDISRHRPIPVLLDRKFFDPRTGNEPVMGELVDWLVGLLRGGDEGFASVGGVEFLLDAG
jgi:hypothetical protein